MAEADIPEEVIRFLAEYIESLFQLEVLLLVQAHPETAWTAERVDRETRIGLESVKGLLAMFEKRGLLSYGPDPELSYRYQPETEELDRAIKLLAVTYKKRRVKVTSFIYSSPLDKIRDFAEAFRMRKD